MQPFELISVGIIPAYLPMISRCSETQAVTVQSSTVPPGVALHLQDNPEAATSIHILNHYTVFKTRWQYNTGFPWEKRLPGRWPVNSNRITDIGTQITDILAHRAFLR